MALPYPYTFSELQSLTRAAPTLATEGQGLKALRDGAITVVVEAPSGQTLSGAGILECYIYDEAIEGWSRLKAAGVDMSISVTGQRRQAFPSVVIATPRNGRILWAANGVTVSAGTQVRIYQLGRQSLRL